MRCLIVKLKDKIIYVPFSIYICICVYDIYIKPKNKLNMSHVIYKLSFQNYTVLNGIPDDHWCWEFWKPWFQKNLWSYPIYPCDLSSYVTHSHGWMGIWGLVLTLPSYYFPGWTFPELLFLYIFSLYCILGTQLLGFVWNYSEPVRSMVIVVGWVGTFTQSQTPEEVGCCSFWRFLKIFFSGRKCTFGTKPFWTVKFLSLSVRLIWTSCMSYRSSLRVLSILPFVFGFSGFKHKCLQSHWPKESWFGEPQELLGLLFSSSGIAVLCCLFCLSPCLKQPQFSPELQLSAMGWTAFT